MPQCDHCLLEFPDHDAITNKKGLKFCCHGCLGIHALIHDEGLDGFYGRRDKNWTPGPQNSTFRPDEGAFKDNLREIEGAIEIDLTVEGIRCASCIWLNEKILSQTEGVISAQLNFATHRARIRFNPEITTLRTILQRIASVGYKPRPVHPDAENAAHERLVRDLLIRFGTAAFLSMQLMIYSFALYAGYFDYMGSGTKMFFQLLSLAVATPVVFYSGGPILRGSISALRHGALNMDVLVSSGALAAYVYSLYQIPLGGEVFFDTAAMIITFIILGRLIETGARGRASEAVMRLMNLSPKQAIRIHSETGKRESVDVGSIHPGEMIEILPGAGIPLDGELISGSSEVDESMLTGESRPVMKLPSSEVFKGTVNLYGSFVLKVTRTGADTVLAGIIRAVEDAQTRRAPIQALADRIVGRFVPAVLSLGVATFAYRMITDTETTEAMMNAVSVLVIACPCALGLATPMAVLIGTTSAARKGILLKGGDIIERTRHIDIVALDKTGTLTEGKPSLIWHKNVTDDDALSIASALEQHSEHSIGKALLHASENITLHEVKDFLAVPGSGVQGIIEGKQAFLGSKMFLNSHVDVIIDHETSKEIEKMQNSGATVVYLAHGGTLTGIFAVRDNIRPDAIEALKELKSMGKEIILMTGDNKVTSNAIAREAGIEDVHAEMSPIDKASEIRELKARGKRVVMAGDGINDSPSLIEADVGVAVGRASDIALESADVVLMHGELKLLPESMKLAEKTFSVIRQNLFWAFAYNIVAIPLAVAGILHPIVAAAAMALSSLTVALNSLRASVK
ncbi:heavy metal translocating P-type ATPase metal-binding domain-containing protein [Nitrospirota bacterium]